VDNICLFYFVLGCSSARAIFISFVVAMPMAYGQLQREQLEAQRQRIEQFEVEKAEIIAMIDEAVREKKR